MSREIDKMNTLSAEFIQWLKSAVGNKAKDLRKRIISFCVEYDGIDVFESDGCILKSDVAQKFGISLCGNWDFKPNTRLYRYTSLRSLIRTLNEGKQSMCSLVAMNDKTERNYFVEYIQQYSTYASCKKLIEDNLKTYNNDNHYYITSLMTKDNKDDLDMWRIYGDEARGVMLEYEIRDSILSKSFFLSPISYAGSQRKNGTIRLIFDLISHTFSNNHHIHFSHLDAWQHMFKPYEYHKEKEVRLLHVSQNVDKWINNEEYNIIMPIKQFDMKNEYPLNLTSIMLGPKLAEKEINKEMLSSMLKNKGLTNIPIIESSIYSYR